MNVAPSNDWAQVKLWNGEFLPNYFISPDGNIFHINGDTILPKKIGPAETCYLVYMHGMRFDARKVMWRAFTQEKPMYSQEHYRVHIVEKTRKDLLAFNNLGFTIESSTFNQWTKEDENWPWKRSSKGNVPIHLRAKREKKAVRKEKEQRKQTSVKSKKTSHAKKATPPKKASPAKKTTPAKKAKDLKQNAAVQRKKVKLMSERKFEALRFKKRMNITITEKEREIYEEQRVLRDLKKFLG